MKLIHLSDLHLGKRVNEFSMLEDQKYILQEILKMIDDEKPDGILIAGDIYDKPVPPAEAVELFNDFLVSLAERKLQVFAVSGNHDSPERIAFGSRLMDMSGIHLSPVYTGEAASFSLSDEYGTVTIYMLPFVKPAHVRRYFAGDEITSYTDALRCAVDRIPFDPAGRNVLVTHQFVTGALRAESEEVSVGGSDNVDAAVFDRLDYVALGHLHIPQNVGSERIRYAGAPLKYSFSEASHEKSVTIVELEGKGTLRLRTVPLTPQHDLTEIRGTYAELTLKSFYADKPFQDDYLHITLTDEEDIPDAVGKLRVIYRNLMKLDYDNKRTRHQAEIDEVEEVESKPPLELFAELYERQNGAPLSNEQTAFMTMLIEKVWGAEQ